MTDAALGEGDLLIATPQLLDPNFHRTVILVLEHTEDGTLGVVLNRPSEFEPLDELPEWLPLLAPPSVVFVGGPVQPDAAVGLAENVGSQLGGAELVDLSAAPGSLASRVRVFAGYAGWGPGQLSDEIGEGAWVVVEAQAGDVFSEEAEELWQEILARQPGRLAWLSSFPPDPRLN